MKVFGVWMWPLNVRKYGAAQVVCHCAKAGITDLFFLVKGLAGTTAYPSAFAPAVCECDLLKELIREAHKCGMRVHAWFTSACDEHYKKLHPESGRCHFVRGKDRELISLADEGYLTYMEKIIREVCRGYDIDGLHLDYIRYNHLIYGWAEEDVQRYQQHGASGEALRQMMERTFCGEKQEIDQVFDAYRAGDENLRALARARRADVWRFAQTLTQAAKAEKPDLILSAALMPEGAYEDTAFADLHYGQSYEDAAKLYDYALPMSYSCAYEKDAAWVKNVAEGTLKHGIKTVAGLHAFEGGTGITLAQDIAALKDTAVEGICLFREGAFVMAHLHHNELTLWNALEETITSVKLCAGQEELSLDVALAPGEEKVLPVPFVPEVLRVFGADGEKSVYLTCQ